ncbi:unnamed protein product, partial [Brassica napus]
FRERLTEGSVYTLSRFDVTRSNPKFKLTDGPVSIRFNEGTDFEKLVATARTIPTEHFRFRPHEQIIELANTSRQLLATKTHRYRKCELMSTLIGPIKKTPKASISKSYLWPFPGVYTLTITMRPRQADKDFAEWILKVGNGTTPTVNTERRSHEDGEQVIIGDEFMLPSSDHPHKSISDAAYPVTAFQLSQKCSASSRI